MKLINLKSIIVLITIAFTASGITRAGWIKELPNGISVVFNADDYSLRLMSIGDSPTCVFEIQKVENVAIHPNQNAIMIYQRDNSIKFKTIVNENGNWHEIQTPPIPLDNNCIGTRYQGSSCAYRLLKSCNIFIIMLPHAVQIFEFADSAWNELCIIEGAKNIQLTKNFPEQNILHITAVFEENGQKFTREFDYNRESLSLKKI
jgi:hypothetical protein